MFFGVTSPGSGLSSAANPDWLLGCGKLCVCVSLSFGQPSQKVSMRLGGSILGTAAIWFVDVNPTVGPMHIISTKPTNQQSHPCMGLNSHMSDFLLVSLVTSATLQRVQKHTYTPDQLKRQKGKLSEPKRVPTFAF